MFLYIYVFVCVFMYIYAYMYVHFSIWEYGNGQRKHPVAVAY